MEIFDCTRFVSRGVRVSSRAYHVGLLLSPTQEQFAVWSKRDQAELLQHQQDTFRVFLAIQMDVIVHPVKDI